MSVQQDPFYLVKEEIQQLVNKSQATFSRWEQLPKSSVQEFLDLGKELSTGCETIEWQVGELDRAIAVAERFPARFGVNEAEIALRKKWTSSTHNQIFTIRKALQNASDMSSGRNQGVGSWKDLILLPDHKSAQRNGAATRQNGKFGYETDIEALLLKEEDNGFGHLIDIVKIRGEVGVELHTEMSSNTRLIDELSEKGMDHNSSRLDFVQKRMEKDWKKAGWRAQVSAILALVGLLIVLTYLALNT